MLVEAHPAAFARSGERNPVARALRGTNFQVRVWEALMALPEGAAASYGSLAHAIGQRAGAQAIGQAVGANLLALLIPCHRVIRADGSLGGYRWGRHEKPGFGRAKTIPSSRPQKIPRRLPDTVDRSRPKHEEIRSGRESSVTGRAGRRSPERGRGSPPAARRTRGHFTNPTAGGDFFRPVGVDGSRGSHDFALAGRMSSGLLCGWR